MRTNPKVPCLVTCVSTIRNMYAIIATPISRANNVTISTTIAKLKEIGDVNIKLAFLPLSLTYTTAYTPTTKLSDIQSSLQLQYERDLIEAIIIDHI